MTKKIYELMKSSQGKPYPKHKIKCLKNIKEDINPLIKVIDKLTSKEDPSKWIMQKVVGAKPDQYCQSVSEHYNVPFEQVHDWYFDKKYIKLTMNETTTLQLSEDFNKNLEKLIKKIFNFKTNVWMSLYLQRPGEFCPLHYDRKKYKDFNIEETDVDNIKRYVIFLKDQEEGQVFWMAGQYITWKAGDVLEWNQIDYPHGSANFGFEDRPALIVTGVL